MGVHVAIGVPHVGCGIPTDSQNCSERCGEGKSGAWEPRRS